MLSISSECIYLYLLSVFIFIFFLLIFGGSSLQSLSSLEVASTGLMSNNSDLHASYVH